MERKRLPSPDSGSEFRQFALAGQAGELVSLNRLETILRQAGWRVETIQIVLRPPYPVRAYVDGRVYLAK